MERRGQATRIKRVLTWYFGANSGAVYWTRSIQLCIVTSMDLYWIRANEVNIDLRIDAGLILPSLFHCSMNWGHGPVANELSDSSTDDIFARSRSSYQWSLIFVRCCDLCLTEGCFEVMCLKHMQECSFDVLTFQWRDLCNTAIFRLRLNFGSMLQSSPDCSML